MAAPGSDAVSHAYGLYEDLLERKRIGKLTARRRLSDDPVFEKTAEEIVVIPDGCTEIGSEAFAYSANLKQVVLPASVTGIDPTAFDECEEVVAIVPADASADAAADAAEAAGLIVLRK